MKKTGKKIEYVDSLKPLRERAAESSEKGKKRRRIPVFLIIVTIWLISVTVVICRFYGKEDDYLRHYEEVYQVSSPELVADEIFEHFRTYDAAYILEHMAQVPRISAFEDESSVKQYILNMIDGKEMSFQPSSRYSDAVPTYVVEADGFVIAEFSLIKDLQNPREFGFPTWQIKEINYYTEPYETVNISAPANFSVYVNGVLLDEAYICSEERIPDDVSYLLEYGTMPGIIDYYVADLYLEPEVRIIDMFGDDVEVSYDESTDFYSAGYTDMHPEKDMLREFAFEYTITFASVISQDARLESLLPYFPENSQLYDSISRNTALQYFMSHSATEIENEEILDFVAYSDDVVYIEVYIEQHMTVGWETVEVVPTTARLYCVRIDGDWKVVSMRF